ncbi:hypothetical protein Q1695_011205 [Nippostrongylus brasiliensis]|nr:hypothetical protein Q1695_011205 [Nippostrongylus brasiliensis]
MQTRTFLVIAVCALLLVNSFECKKQNKESKNKKSKGGKGSKEQNVETKSMKNKSQKPEKEKVKVEKAAKAEKPAKPVIEVDEVIIEAPEVETAKENEVENHVHAAESIVDTINHRQAKPIIRPKSLRALNAYEKCKLECRRQRDSVQAQEYVDQLRAELQAAEEVLAAEAAAAAAATAAPAAQAVPVEDVVN